MAKKPNPFAKFEKSGKDVEGAKFGKEGSKKEEAFDKKQANGFARGGKVKCMATGGSARGTGAAQRGTGFKSGQC